MNRARCGVYAQTGCGSCNRTSYLSFSGKHYRLSQWFPTVGAPDYVPTTHWQTHAILLIVHVYIIWTHLAR